MKILIFIIFISIFLNSSNSQECGKQKVGTSFSVGSEYATKGQWPWMAPLFYSKDDKFFCGSTIISKRHLLGASHCFKDKGERIPTSPESIYTLLGLYDISQPDEKNVVRAGISSITFHPDWNPQIATYDADIAILRLVNEIKFTKYIQPVCLPQTENNVYEIEGTIVGYGLSENRATHEIRPKFVKINSTTQENCLFSHEIFSIISSKRMFCAGSRGKNPCRGDSGGGFYIKSSGSYFIMGIISSSIHQECIENEYALFTNIPKFASWINNAIDAKEGEEFGEWRPEPLKCQFFYNQNDDRYECYSEFNLRSLVPNVRISTIEGEFSDGKTYSDVDTVSIKEAKVTFIPDLTAANEKFPNFVKLFIVLSGLKYIERSKLAKMPQLKILNFYGNEIEHFDADVFNDLRNLEILAFVENKIKILPQQLLWNLINLKEIWSYNNPIEAIPIRFFKNNKKLVKAWMGYSKIKRIDVNFKAFRDLELLDLRSNECIDLQGCKTCTLTVENLQDKIDEQCGPGSVYGNSGNPNSEQSAIKN